MRTARKTAWDNFRRLSAIETVVRDPRPVRAVIGVIMTCLATGAGLTYGGYYALKMIELFANVAHALQAL